MSKYHEVSLGCPTCGTYELTLSSQPISIAPYISLPPFPALFPEKVTELEGPPAEGQCTILVMRGLVNSIEAGCSHNNCSAHVYQPVLLYNIRLTINLYMYCRQYKYRIPAPSVFQSCFVSTLRPMNFILAESRGEFRVMLLSDM